MPKCRKCKRIIQDGYTLCYECFQEKHLDYCKVHGRTTFNHGQCVKCTRLKQPLYKITKKGKNYYDKDGKIIPKDSLIYPCLPFKKQPFLRISSAPGIYGVFCKDQCLYIGQSVDVSNRVKQHKENFKTAQYHLNGLRIRRKSLKVKDIKNYKVEIKYYKMADKYTLSELKFVRIMSFPKKTPHNKELKEALTYCEQAYMDLYKPIFNLFSARPSGGK